MVAIFFLKRSLAKVKCQIFSFSFVMPFFIYYNYVYKEILHEPRQYYGGSNH